MNKRSTNFVQRPRKNRKSNSTTTKTTKSGSVLSVVRSIASQINSEGKIYTTTASNSSATSSALITCLSGMAQGDDDNTRNGNSILPSGLRFTYSVQFNSSNTDSLKYVRILLFIDHNNNADTPMILGNILTQTSSGQLPISQVNHSYDDRVEPLYDHTHWLDAYHAQVSEKVKIGFNPPSLDLDKYWHITYNGGTSSDTKSNNIYLVVIGSGTTNMHTFSYQSDLYYYDN